MPPLLLRSVRSVSPAAPRLIILMDRMKGKNVPARRQTKMFKQITPCVIIGLGVFLVACCANAAGRHFITHRPVLPAIKKTRRIMSQRMRRNVSRKVA